MAEMRRFERFALDVEVRVTWPGKGMLIGTTRDFSDGGAFVQVDFGAVPVLGTQMQLQLNDRVAGEEAPLLQAEVVRVEPHGLAFAFLPEPE